MLYIYVCFFSSHLLSSSTTLSPSPSLPVVTQIHPGSNSGPFLPPLPTTVRVFFRFFFFYREKNLSIFFNSSTRVELYLYPRAAIGALSS